MELDRDGLSRLVERLDLSLDPPIGFGIRARFVDDLAVGSLGMTGQPD
jgi:hypothetical protein